MASAAENNSDLSKFFSFTEARCYVTNKAFRSGDTIPLETSRIVLRYHPTKPNDPAFLQYLKSLQLTEEKALQKRNQYKNNSNHPNNSESPDGTRSASNDDDQR